MPCRVDLFRCDVCGGEHYYDRECLKDPSKHREGLSGHDSHAFNTDGALCDVLSLLEEKNLLEVMDIPKDIMEWWAKHQSKEVEKTKKEALAKLSDKEKRALGL